VKKYKYSIFLLVLLIFSFFFRVYKINTLSLFGDEIDVGYQAFSLLNTGKDYKGNFLPTYIQSLSESRAPLLIYSSIPGIKLFGLTELGVRITPIIFGILSLYVFYKLILLLSKSNILALLSTTAMSFSPWHFHYSRTSFEVTLLTFLLLFGTYFIFKYLDQSKNKFLYLSILFYCLSFYTYNTANIFVPLLVIFIFITNFSKFKSKLKIKPVVFSSLIFLIIISPLAYQIFFGSAANRFNLISIFKDQTLINNIIEKRTIFSASSNPKIESIFHNKPIVWTQELIKNYISSFSLPFLFNSGDQLNLRHSVPGIGLLFISFLPLLFIGLIPLDLHQKLNKLMLFWLIISPLASSLTVNGGNHATRLFLMLIPLSFFIGLGATKLLNTKNIFSKIILLILIFTSLIEICSYSHEYFIHYPKDSFQVWNRGYKEIFQSIPSDSPRVFVSNTKYNSLLSYLFYQNYSPKNLNHLQDTEQPNIAYDMSGFKLTSNTYFINNWQSQNDIFKKMSQIAQKGDTFVLFQLNEIPGDMNLYQQPIPGFSTIRTIFNPNQTILGQVIQKQ
jgi:4-amino-4-deoxy-L-arabinose transferase-like glycosyltransferase